MNSYHATGPKTTSMPFCDALDTKNKDGTVHVLHNIVGSERSDDGMTKPRCCLEHLPGPLPSSPEM